MFPLEAWPVGLLLQCHGQHPRYAHLGPTEKGRANNGWLSVNLPNKTGV